MSHHPAPLFPVFLRLHGRRVVLVGGGPVAAAKLESLVAAGAHVAIVAPEISDAVERVASQRSEISIARRPFAEANLDGAWFVVAAAPPEVNREVGRAAQERSLFVNAVDDKDSASAYLGGVVRKGGVTVSVGTDGAAPALTGLLREALEAVLPDELSRWADVARQARTDWKRAGVPLPERRPLLLRALNLLYERRARTDGSSKPSTLDSATKGHS